MNTRSKAGIVKKKELDDDEVSSAATPIRSRKDRPTQKRKRTQVDDDQVENQTINDSTLPNITPIRSRKKKRARIVGHVAQTPSAKGIEPQFTKSEQKDEEIYFNTVADDFEDAGTDTQSPEPVELPPTPAPKISNRKTKELDDALLKTTIKNRRRKVLSKKKSKEVNEEDQAKLEEEQRKIREQEENQRIQQIVAMQAIIRGSLNHQLYHHRFTSANAAATLVQTFVKMIWVRRNYISLRKAVVRLQAVARGFLARRYVRKQISAVITIQSATRMYVAKSTYLRDLSNVILIQSLVRAKLARQQYGKHVSSVKIINTAIRTFLARKRFNEQKAAITVQRSWKQFVARKAAKIIEIRNVAAVHIQAVWHAHRHQMQFQRIKSAVLSIQTQMKRHLAQRNYRITRDRVTTIQALINAHIARKQTEQIRQHLAQLQAQKELEAVTLIQEWWHSNIVPRLRKRFYKRLITCQAIMRSTIVARQYDVIKQKHDAKITKKENRVELFREQFKRKVDQLDYNWDDRETKRQKKRMEIIDQKFRNRYGASESLFGTQEEMESIEELRKRTRKEVNKKRVEEDAEDRVARIAHEMDTQFPYLVPSTLEDDEDDENVAPIETPKKQLRIRADDDDDDLLNVEFTPKKSPHPNLTTPLKGFGTPSARVLNSFNLFSPAHRTPNQGNTRIFHKYQQMKQSQPITPSRQIIMPPLTPVLRENSRKKIEERQKTPKKPIELPMQSPFSKSSPFIGKSPFKVPSSTPKKRKLVEIQENEEEEEEILGRERKRVFLGTNFSWKSPKVTKTSKLILTPAKDRQVQWKDSYDPELEVAVEGALVEQPSTYTYSPRHTYYEEKSVPSIFKFSSVEVGNMGRPPKAGERKRNR
jgi:hypothetical protein